MPNVQNEIHIALCTRISRYWPYSSFVCRVSFSQKHFEQASDSVSTGSELCNDLTQHNTPYLCREDEILSQLTPNLRAEVTHFAHYDTVRLLKRMRLFEDLEDTLLTRLIVALTTQFMPPDELVCAEGELGEVVYLIRKGVVSVRLEFTAPGIFTPLCEIALAKVAVPRHKQQHPSVARRYRLVAILSQ